MTIEVIHRIDRPFSDGTIEVYGEPDMGWYEWRILERGEVLHDTRAAGYGSASLALRDALNHDEPPEPPPVVPISWVPGRDASSENLMQAHRLLDLLRGVATDLVTEAHDAKIQRRANTNGRLGMIYTSERTATAQYAAQVLNDAADKMLTYSHKLTKERND